MKLNIVLLTISMFFALLSCGSEGDESAPKQTPITDTTPPSISIASNIAEDNEVTSNESSSLIISGTSDAENSQTVNITLTDFFTTITSTALVSNRAWSSSPINISNLYDGPILIKAQVSDAAGNFSQVAQKEIILNQNEIVIEITQPIALDNKIVFAESRVIRVSGSTNLVDGRTVTVRYSDDENTVTSTGIVESGKWRSNPADLNALNNGNISVSASASNTSGDKAQSLLREIPLDKSIRPMAPSEDGTVWISNQVATDSDETLFESITPAGAGSRLMFDYRTSSFNQQVAWLFNVVYSDGILVEAQVNQEFTQAEALAEATYYSTEIGRLPKFLRKDLYSLWIHKGNNSFGGGNNNFVIHIGLGDEVLKPRGHVNEVFIHEGAHTSLDVYIKDDPEWLYAQQADGGFISEYARDNPNREDIAESLLLYFAYKYRPNTISQGTKMLIESTMSYRMKYFDQLNLDWSPLIK